MRRHEQTQAKVLYSPPLVKGVDVPQDSLSEDLHLVHHNEGTEGEWSELLHHDGVGGAITLKHLVWEDAFLLVLRHTSLGQLSLHLCRSLALHESLSLSQKVGQKQLWRQKENFIILT